MTPSSGTLHFVIHECLALWEFFFSYFKLEPVKKWDNGGVQRMLVMIGYVPQNKCVVMLVQ